MTFTVVAGREEVAILETDDWLEAERAASVTFNRPAWERYGRVRIRGTHPTHTFSGDRCTTCGAWDNGSYGSHAPCGFVFRHSLYHYMKEASDEHDGEASAG